MAGKSKEQANPKSGAAKLLIPVVIAVGIVAGIIVIGATSNQPITCTFKEGERLYFELTDDSEAYFNPATVLDSGQGASIGSMISDSMQKEVLTATMVWQVMDVADSGTTTISARMTKLDVDAGGREVDEARKRRYGRPVAFKLDKSCRIEEFAFGTIGDESVERRWQLILQMLEFVTPENPLAADWTAVQTDATGEYESRYTRGDEDPASGEIRKERVRFISVRQPNPKVKLEAKVVDSRASAKWVIGQSWFDEMDIYEHILLQSERGTFADVKATKKLRRIEAGQAAQDDDALISADTAARERKKLLTDSVWRTASEFSVQSYKTDQLPFLRLVQPEDIAGMDYGQIMAEFARLLATDDTKMKEKAVAMLARYILSDRAKPQEVLNKIRLGEIDEGDEPWVFLAYQVAGGKPVHQALESAISDPELDLANRLQAVAALHDVRDPDKEVVDKVIEFSKGAAPGDEAGDVKNSATLSIGALIDRDSVADSDKKRLKEELGNRLESAESAGETATLLASVENSSDKGFSEKVEAYTGDEAPLVRGRAFAALGKLGTKTDGDFWMDALLSETQDEVAGVIGENLNSDAVKVDADTREIAREKLPQMESVAKRKAVIGILGKAAATEPESKQALKDQFMRETDTDAKKLIGQYLSAQDLSEAMRGE